MWRDDVLARLFDPRGLRTDVHAAVARSDLWGRRFRAVAGIGLMLVKNFQGRSKFIGAMQMNARRIWTVLERERPDFPLVRETYRTVLEDDLDIGTAERWLEGAAGRITMRDLSGPPPSCSAWWRLALRIRCSSRSVTPSCVGSGRMQSRKPAKEPA